MNKKIIFKSLVYLIAGDIIGFSNGKLKFNNIAFLSGILTNKTEDYLDIGANETDLLFFRFYNSGMIEGLVYRYHDYIISYNPLFSLAILQNLNEKNNLDKIIKNIRLDFIKLFEEDKEKKIRKYDKNFIDKIKKLKSIDYNFLDEKYNFNENSSDPAVRSFILGLYYYNNKNLNDLIYLCIHTTRLTHNNGISILGSICSALFANFAVNKLDIKQWPFELLKILNSENFEKIYFQNTNNYDKYLIDLKLYKHVWNKYIKNNLIKNDGKIKLNIEIINRFDIEYVGNKLKFLFMEYTNNKDIFYPGNNGDDCMILVYHFLLELNIDIFKKSPLMDNKYLYNRLIAYSAYNIGNSANLSAIASGLFGLLFDYNNIETILTGNSNILDKINIITKNINI